MTNWNEGGGHLKSNDRSSCKSRGGSAVALTGKQLYEGSVKLRAIGRAGANANINGHVLEIMAGDKTNLNPLNWARGVSEHMTKSSTSPCVDAVVMKGGKVLQRIQYKDCSHSIGDVVRRVRDGQYRTTTLKGTTETARVYNRYAAKHGLQRMQDSGISSNTTKSIARSVGSCKSVSVHSAAWSAAKSGGAVSAIIGGGISAIGNVHALCTGEKTAGEAACGIIKDTAGAYVTGAGSCYAATAVGAGTAAACTALGVTGAAAAACTIGAPLVAAVGVGWLIGKAWKGLFG